LLLWLVAVARSPLLVKGLESILSVSGLSKKKKESQLVLIVVNPKRDRSRKTMSGEVLFPSHRRKA